MHARYESARGSGCRITAHRSDQRSTGRGWRIGYPRWYKGCGGLLHHVAASFSSQVSHCHLIFRTVLDDVRMST
jgi:hypothetical protein